jgi:hypothetical protein
MSGGFFTFEKVKIYIYNWCAQKMKSTSQQKKDEFKCN